MRYIRLNNLIIDTQNQLLLEDGKSITLPPKVYELLVYFCQNSQRLVSKDELMEQVWTGTLVTDNAISRTLVKVRKALGDDPKEPHFIVTVPRKGYRMTADCQFSDNIEPEQGSTDTQGAGGEVEPQPSMTRQSVSKELKKYWKIGAGVLTMMLAAALWGVLDKQTVVSSSNKQLSALTRDAGEELYPDVSADLSSLAYTKRVKGSPDYLVIETLVDQNRQVISHPRGALSRPTFAPDNSQLAFLYRHNQVCRIFVANIDAIKNKENWRQVSECGSSSYPSMAFSPDGQYLFFNDRTSDIRGYQIFRVELATLDKDIVNQPITNGRGNYAFDISPGGEQLVMLNSEYQAKTRVYTLQLEQARLQQTAQLPYFLRTVLWHHDGQTIVHPAPHPAYDIWHSDLSGNKLGVIASNGQRVKQLARVGNGEDYVFTSFLLNRDVHFIHDDTESVLQNSTVMDYLPVLSNSGEQYAFVSKRSSHAEVYLAHRNAQDTAADNNVTRLTYFNDSMRFYQLGFSPEDKQLFVLADNQLFVVDLEGSSIKELSLGNRAVRGVSWLNEQTLLMSMSQNDSWYWYRYDLETQQAVNLPHTFAGGLFSPQDQSFYGFLKQTGEVMRLKDLDGSPESVSLDCPKHFVERKLNLKLMPQGIVCANKNNPAGWSVLSYQGENEFNIDMLKNTHNLDFDSHDQDLIYTNMTQAVADIMRTSSQ